MKKPFSLCLILIVLFFMLACGGKKSESSETDNDTNDIDISDVEISDNDSDNPQGPDADSDDPDIPDNEVPDEDSDTPENPEVTENHKISGTYQIGDNISGIKTLLAECGSSSEIASAKTDAQGRFSFNADISADKTYCVKAGNFASCFKGLSDHVANISEITTAVYLVDTECAEIRKSETMVRAYAKLGTGKWLGELDYSKLSGIREGLRLLASYLDTTDPKTLSEKIAADIMTNNGRGFHKFFNGFKISADKREVIIDTENPDNNEVLLGIEGGSSVVAEDFNVLWTDSDKTAGTAAFKFKSTKPGEYTVRARLFYTGDPEDLGDPIMDDALGDPIMLSADYSTLLFLLEKTAGTIDVSDTTKDISHYIDNGIYAVIPRNTVIKKGGNKVNTLTYKILTAGDGSQVSKISFEPEGTVFTNDSLYFVYELGTVFGGDPIMLSATRTNTDGSGEVLQSVGGDPVMLEALGDPIMFSAHGDPILRIVRSGLGDPIMMNALGDPIMQADGEDPVSQAELGDPIMGSALGDPIMGAAMGDPIMMGTSSSVMIAKTDHFSGFLLNSNSLPVSVDALVSRWCDGSYYRNYSPLEFIRRGVQQYKPEGEDKNDLLSYLDCSKIGDLGNDLYELINKEVGYQRNLNLFENFFYTAEFYIRMLGKRMSGEFVAAKNGLELRSAIASLYTATTSLNRSATLADLFAAPMVPLTYSGAPVIGFSSSDAQLAVTGLSEIDDKYVATKKEMMILANYITTSSKGPDFSGVSSPMVPSYFICAWFTGSVESCDENSKIYKLNENGHVTANGTEVTVAEAEEIFARFLMPMNSRLSDEEKLDLFRTYYLALRYVGTIFYREPKVTELYDNLLKTAYLVFDGINKNKNAVTIVDTFDAAANTVAVLENGEMTAKPYLNRLSSLTDLISLNVATAANVEKVLIKSEGYAYEKVTENTRTYYKPKGDLKENSITLTPGNLEAGLKPLKELIGSNNVDALGNIAGKMTVVVNSKISGKTYSTQKTYEFLINDKSEGVESKPLPSNLSILIHDAAGSAIAVESNPGMILNPGNRTYYPNEDGEIRIENLAPASYTISAFADGYYAKNVGVNVPENATIGVEIRLDEEIVSSHADAALTLKVNINTVKHPDKVYIQIYDEDMELVANESAKFNEASNGYDDVEISIDFGRYTLLAVGEEMYNYLEAITVNDENTVKEITVVAKNACGNGIIDAGEECETGDSDSTTVRCGDVFPASANPDNEAVCNKTKCVYDKAACGAQTYSNCGDGIIDPGEGCDGGTKACSEILGANVKGTAPCAENCSDWVIANNCTKTTAECAARPANTIWNDGTGRFTQTYNGSSWLPAAKEAAYGTTRDECVFSCDIGYKWDGSQCIAAPLSLGNLCTGETSCFDNSTATECPAYGKTFFGQDAQYALVGYCTEKSFSQKGSNPQFIVVDDFTHYEWHKVAGGAQTWDAAEEYCRTSTYGGTQLYWKLPTPVELMTIVDSGRTDSPLADIFTTPGHTFWADEDSRNSENAWRINENGALESVAKSTENYVLCIHVNEYDAPAQRFTAAEETVTDNVSGLIWQKQYASSKSWAEALSYCEELTTSGHYDWRLPNRNELASLIDFEKADGAVSDFPAIAAKGFWTSTSSLTEATKAWAVDFATGTISAEQKAETNYLLCVRSENECIGNDCVDACDFEPCRNIKNSTGVCTATAGTFICGCKSRFHWNNSRCELDTVLHSNCDLNSLPKHGHWNIYSSIDQTCDDEDDCDWYPSTTGEYNETPNPNECRFVCNTDKGYVWNGDDCVGKTQIVDCGSANTLPDNAQWHDPGMIVQQWGCNDLETICNWDITSDAAFSEDPVDNRCRFKCNEHYTWHGETCDADEQPADCDGLADNATWWNESITQTWNGSGWEPSNTGTYSKTSVENECVFRCNDGFFWNGSTCTSPCTGATNPCSTDTHSTGTCTATSIADYKCECSNGYYWWDNQGCIDRKPVALGNICTQTEKCYNNDSQIECPAYGEDFYGQASQYAANGICVAQSITNKSVLNEETSLDNNTGLEWKKSMSPTSFYSQEEAIEYCENLEYAGHGDWRLPTLNEMLTVLSYKPFISGYNLRVWSADSYGESGAIIWSTEYMWLYSNFDYSSSPIFGSAVETLPNYAICVRGNELPASEFIVSEINGDKVVKDNSTGLMWQKTYSSGSWQGALSYCENLDYAGFTDWRLPNSNELASNIFSKNTTVEWTPVEGTAWWTSENDSDIANAWYVTTTIAPLLYGFYKNSAAYIRCVRSGFCGDDKFWNGSECVAPCSADSCGGAANAVCIPKSYDTFVCECDNAGDGYFWSGTECVNPCDADPCADVLHSTHLCTSTDWNKHSCGCESGYFWDGTQCVPITLGRVCTGLDKCYNDSGNIIDCPAQGENFFGQDYQYAQLGYCVPRSFRDETVSDQTVRVDDNLGLAWVAGSETYDWYEAKTLCENLASRNYAGRNDWRLPTVKEIFSYIDHSYLYYNNIEDSFWTSDLSGEDYAYTVSLHFKYTQTDDKTDSNKTFCVSGNKIAEANLTQTTVTVGGNDYELVTDSTTRLIWQKNPSESKKTWKNALKYCEDSNDAGLSNWRLPNIHELISLLNDRETIDAPASDFPGTIYGYLVSSSIWRQGSADASTVYLDSGYISYLPTDNGNYVLCVHNDPCEEGKFWNGSTCVNPCDADPCAAVEHWNGDCIPTGWNTHLCGCVDGYAWYGSSCHDLATPADPNYNDTYGTLSLNFYIDRVLNSSDTQLTQSDVFMGYFAAGTYGNSTASVVPVAYTIYSYAFYDQATITIQQTAISQESTIVNPLLVLAIPEEKATVGEHAVYSVNEENFTLFTNSFSIIVVDASDNGTTCFHALGEGTINISEIGDFTDHGPLGFTGDITLYSPKNYKGYDISSLLDYPTCDPVE